MPEYRAPGVYVEETAAVPPAIAPVETAVPVFIGYTAKVWARGGGRTDRQALRVSSFADYARLFGRAPLHDVSVSVAKRVDASGKLLGVTVDWAGFDPVPRHFMAYGAQAYFLNGGTGCFVYSLGRYRAPRRADFLDALETLETVDGPTLLVMPDAALLDDSDYAAVLDAALASCARRRDRFLVADVARAVPGETDTETSLGTSFRSAITGDSTLLRYGAAYFPYLETDLPLRISDPRVQISGFEIVTVAPDGSESVMAVPDAAGRSLNDGDLRLRTKEPEVYRAVRTFVRDARATVPPSGAVAGLYARVDATQGVWKAPAGAALAAVRQPAVAVDDAFQQALNVDPAAGKSVNAIRVFPGRGTLVWGARSLAGNDSEWRYVNVRRFALFLEQSLTCGLQWAVFEPNDANIWARLRQAAETFLVGLWRQGALQGTKPEQAFAVAAGLGSTMTETDIAAGRIVVQVGFAPLRPAEFILLRIVLRREGS
ncbi:MAG: hypothetical protein Kow00114_11660 [Kiloniellaceae bacterium]